jgi:prohibitin 1
MESIKTGLFVVAGIIALFVALAANPIYIVKSGQKAVIQRFGVIKQKVIEPGMNFKTPFIDQVITMSITPQNAAGEMNTYTKDNQPIDVTYNVLYVKPADDVANTIIRYQSKPYEVFAKAKITDAIKSVYGKYTASEFVTKREVIRMEALDKARLAVVNTEDGKAVIDILDIPITNVTFDQEYVTAIKEKQVAQQNAQKAQYVLQQAQVDAQATVARATGEARALTVKAQAIARSPQVVQLERIKAGQDVIPMGTKTVIIGESAVSKLLNEKE